ncbi:MAG TPA: hypothetical protein ENH12_03205 [Proteobacteria bacterium]|nr:hypothetical protein [Pseudomonadota bacterium]
MILHPIILIPKLALLAVIIVVLVILHGSLPPDQFQVAVILAIAVFILFSIIFWIIVIRTLKNPHSRLARQTILFSASRSSDGFQVGGKEYTGLLGTRGSALSPLRPSGAALLGGKRISVVTDGSFIPANSPIEVIEVKGLRVVVRVVSETGDRERSDEK